MNGPGEGQVACAIPTATWVAQQLREAFPFDSAPRFMNFDRGAVFSAAVTTTLRSMQIEPTRTSFRSCASRECRSDRHQQRFAEGYGSQ